MKEHCLTASHSQLCREGVDGGEGPTGQNDTSHSLSDHIHHAVSRAEAPVAEGTCWSRRKDRGSLVKDSLSPHTQTTHTHTHTHSHSCLLECPAALTVHKSVLCLALFSTFT